VIIKQLLTWKEIDTVTGDREKGRIGMQKYFAVISLALLIFMVVIRAAIMKKREGIRAFVFGKTDKKDFIILPFALLFFYQILIEEAFLKDYYGKEYEGYCQKVRRYF